MAKDQDRIVYRREDGQWVNKRIGADKASSLHTTQDAAADAAKRNLAHQGGGELSIKGLNGQIRNKDTISPGNDPCPPRDKR